MFMWLVDPCLEFIYFNCKAIVQTSSVHLSYSLMRLYTCMLGKYHKPYSFYSFLFPLLCPMTRCRLSDARICQRNSLLLGLYNAFGDLADQC